ncbi:MAG: glycosyltransferase [Elusimicrobiaceae bacterium]|nr:glycosyltransferase [Elusimicrobiaceae bacterium]
MQQEIEQLGAYIIHVGSFKEAKDHDCLIRAYAKAGINEKLVLLGQPSGQPAFLQHAQALVKELQLQDKVIFKGFIKNPFPYIKQAKLFVLSSKYEGFGMVLAEAIALRTPVVSTDCPAGPAEIVGPDFARVLSPVGDIDALAANIKNSLLHPARYTVLLRECFTTREVCRQYMKIINEGIVGIPTV